MLKFGKITNQESFDKWREFAASFGHGSNNPSNPITTVSRNGELMAYWSTINFPIILPAYHPEKCSPRDFKIISETVTDAYCLSSISSVYPSGVCYMGLPCGSKRIVQDEAIAKLGIFPLDKELYRKVPA